MNCWNCGKELTDGAAFCTGCGASAARREPETPEGRALRSLIDHYGVERALESSFRLPGGLGDLLDRPEPLRTHLKLALDAGLGQLLLVQLRENGAAPAADFAAQERALLTDRAGLSEPAAENLMHAVDEMLGWQSGAAVCAQPVERPMERPVEDMSAFARMAPAPASVAAQEQAMARRKLGIFGIVMLLLLSLFDMTTWTYAIGRLLPASVRLLWSRYSSYTDMLISALCIGPVLMSMLALYLTGKGNRRAARGCAVVNAVLMVVMVAGVAKYSAQLALFELPMVLYAGLLVLVAARDSVEPWTEAGMWGIAMLCVGCFVALSFAYIGKITGGMWAPLRWTPKVWNMRNWFEKVFLSGATYYRVSDPTACCLTAFFPPHRILLAAMTAVWLRVLRKRQG